MNNEKLNILKLLIETQDRTWSIRQIALERRINYKSAYNAIQKLHQEKIINVTTHGNISLCAFNQKYNSSVLTVEYHRLQQLLHNKNFKVIYNRLKAINQQYILLLFGSYAKKKNNKYSDIDLLAITDNNAELQTQVKLLPLPIHLTTISYNDFQTMLKSKEFSVVSEAIKHNIILFGVEDYYRLLNNAR